MKIALIPLEKLLRKPSESWNYVMMFMIMFLRKNFLQRYVEVTLNK